MGAGEEQHTFFQRYFTLAGAAPYLSNFLFFGHIYGSQTIAMISRYTVLYEVRSNDCQSECAICSHFFLLKIVS